MIGSANLPDGKPLLVFGSVVEDHEFTEPERAEFHEAMQRAIGVIAGALARRKQPVQTPSADETRTYGQRKSKIITSNGD